jgi:hypothetical protein
MLPGGYSSRRSPVRSHHKLLDRGIVYNWDGQGSLAPIYSQPGTGNHQ